MNYKTIMGFCLIGAACFSCKQGVEQKQEAEIKDTHKTVFAKGDKITNDNFIGTVWLEMLVREDSINQNSVGSVTFEPGARTNWHSHPNGQIILAIEGEGFYQEKGSPKRILKAGDAVKCPPNTPHWHGASDTQTFVQLAISSRVDGPAQWLEPVTDEVYNGL